MLGIKELNKYQKARPEMFCQAAAGVLSEEGEGVGRQRVTSTKRVCSTVVRREGPPVFARREGGRERGFSKDLSLSDQAEEPID
ncbi:hypothetical protein Taro_046171 [Colocasia esculenta]|uniref:Uncharacterized protein n=1 Tax=Colocasia esculenta TaxID=4460 RepID=A0A843X5S1_COLES|nr:hypothetical protein [Colocasia esculenta]